MKNLLLSVMVLATLVSCGKDNKVASTAPVAATPVNNAITVTDQRAIELGGKIDQHPTYFGTGQVQLDYYTVRTYQQIASSGEPMYFHYTKSSLAVGGSNSNCETKWKIFYVCSYSSSSGSSSGITKSREPVSVHSIDLGTKIAELKGIINNASTLYPVETDGQTYKIRVKDGRQYIIDLRYPLQAQPMGVMNSAQTESEYIYKISKNP